MTIQTHILPVSRPSLWTRNRFQLGVGILLAVFLPWWIRIRLAESAEEVSRLPISVIGTSIAVLGGYFGFRKFSKYPGVRAGYPILPSLVIAYGAILSVFFFARLDYSRLHFMMSFAICVAYYHSVYFFMERRRKLRIGIVPAGEVDQLYRISGVEWQTLMEPPGSTPTEQFDVIVADLRADMPRQWEHFLAECALSGTLVMHVKQLQESLTGRVAIEHLSENTLGSLIPGIVYGKVKRLADLGAAAAALLLLLPFLLLIAVAIRLDSPGPVIFRQERVGYRGRIFTMYKFRTMRHRTTRPEDERSAAMTKDDDDRITRLGAILRLYRIDELPQLINVLKGEMSWIGPRPEAAPLSRWYEQELPYYRYRHIVRPGITGWAQVKQGHVAEVDEVLWKLHYDFYYIKNFSFWLDALIVAGTARTVLNGFGAR